MFWLVNIITTATASQLFQCSYVNVLKLEWCAGRVSLCFGWLTTATASQLFQYNFIYIIYDLVPKGAHARGYALQLKIKHC